MATITSISKYSTKYIVGENNVVCITKKYQQPIKSNVFVMPKDIYIVRYSTLLDIEVFNPEVIIFE